LAARQGGGYNASPAPVWQRKHPICGRMNGPPATLHSENASYVEALYETFLTAPDTLSENWRRYFEGRQLVEASPGEAAPPLVRAGPLLNAAKQNAVSQLIAEYRLRGHLEAHTEPLGLYAPAALPSLQPHYHGLEPADLERPYDSGSFPLPPGTPLRELIAALRETYCASIGAEYAYISNAEQVEWLRERFESVRGRRGFTAAQQRDILRSLTAAEGLERYLHRKYVGQKRFSLEGGDALLPLLEHLIEAAAGHAVKEVVIGMAHRGRLNVLVNLLGKRPQDLFSEFEGKTPGGALGSGDVKYHQGFSANPITAHGPVHVTLAFNPSHLEIINPVVEGSVRARQERRGDRRRREVLALLIHGDAAIAGQGVVMETLNLSKTGGYGTGGTLHVVVNNQIGFTTSNPLDARSTLYCTEIAKLIQAPIFHVNGDDPEAVVSVALLALEYRLTFGNDAVIDLVCYRRHGHNEADEPSITQPRMYRAIGGHPTPREIYAQALVRAGTLAPAQTDALAEAYRDALERGEVVARTAFSSERPPLAIDWAPYVGTQWTEPADTCVPAQRIAALADRLTGVPAGFQTHPRVARVLQDRHTMLTGEEPLDWGCAETLAYATLLEDGYRVRLSGQDSGRGTFAHRHAVLHNQDPRAPENLLRHVPLAHVAPEQPRFLCIDSLLSEEAVLAFEYGYASADPGTLVVWEAQFGDFANGAQVVIDQFISSSEAKWQRLCGMVLLLPHGYEGQGPEHSSARLERFLQLCAEHNMQVAVPSLPAQLFHLLRRQMLRRYRRPLVVMSPKSLLRHRQSVSPLTAFTDEGLKLVIGETSVQEPRRVRRVLLCSGKVYFDLLPARDERVPDEVAIVRIEQLYPFPSDHLKAELARYPGAQEVTWVQEEPLNQGAWYQIRHKLQAVVGTQQTLRHIGRPRSAAPAAGYYAQHLAQQQALVDEALDLGQQRTEAARGERLQRTA
jgi:2-oxoglutarate dehydrogenase E1 component